MTTFICLDTKYECFGYYADGELNYNTDIPDNLNRTWKHSPHLDFEGVEYAYLYVGKGLSECCPESLKNRWDRVNQKMLAFLQSFRLAKVSLKENCLYDLIPDQFLLEYFETQRRIVDYVFENYDKPRDYEYRVDLHRMLSVVGRQPITLDKKGLKDKLSSVQARNVLRKMDGWDSISYNQFGTKTGRLTTTKNSFPILTLNKDFRSILKPQNHFFVEYDFNAAEPRVFLALAGWEQPDIDLHQWNADKVFEGKKTREQAKKEFLAWFYNPSDHREMGVYYDRKEVLDKFWDGCYVTNPFDRRIEADEHHALNYIIQSTTSDLVQRQAIKIFKILENRKSTIAFTMHDSVVVDLHLDDKPLIKEIAEVFSDTRFGKFKVNVSAGQDFGEMRKLNV